jgi:putative nucleotidyltransferase with HDIG domain
VSEREQDDQNSGANPPDDSAGVVGYIPLPLRSFLSTEKAHFDIFIRLGDSKFLKVIKKDQAFDPERIRRYEGHQIDTLYLRPEDFTVYVEQCLTLSKAMLKQQPVAISPQKKLYVMTNVAESVFTQIMHLKIDDNAMKHSMTVTHDMVELLESHREMTHILDALQNIGEAFVRHSIGVSALATILAYNMGWQGYSTLSTLAMAGLFHDIGFKELPPGLWDKPRANMTPEEVELYETHPDRGREILSSLRSVPPHVISIVAEHHEKPNGTGFPRRLKFDKILPLSRFIAFADLLALELLESPRNPQPQDGHHVLIRLENIYRHDFPPEYWRSLQRFVDPLRKVQI